jgi:hypothetical protein
MDKPKGLAEFINGALEDRIKNMKAFDDGSVIEIFGGSLIYKESNYIKYMIKISRLIIGI